MATFMLAITADPDDAPDPARYSGVEVVDREMMSAGVLVYSGTLGRPRATTTTTYDDGSYTTTVGPTPTAPLTGLWIIEVPDVVAAAKWAQLAASICRAPVETRETVSVVPKTVKPLASALVTAFSNVD